MGKFSNIIIVSDMDGTFLGERSRIVPENIEAIEYFNRNGGHFTFNTGRGRTTVVDRFPDILGIITAPLGLHNGSCIYDLEKNKALDSLAIDTETVLAMTERLTQIPDIDFTLRTLNGFYALSQYENGNYRNFVKSYPDHCSIITMDDIPALDVQKILYIGEQSVIDCVRAEFEERFPDRIHCTSGGANYIEIDPYEANKGRPVKLLKKVMNLPNAKIFGIGDYENDLEMLQTADYAACPENAMDKVKEISDIHVCHHDKGAIAHLIQIIEEKYIG